MYYITHLCGYKDVDAECGRNCCCRQTRRLQPAPGTTYLAVPLVLAGMLAAATIFGNKPKKSADNALPLKGRRFLFTSCFYTYGYSHTNKSSGSPVCGAALSFLLFLILSRPIHAPIILRRLCQLLFPSISNRFLYAVLHNSISDTQPDHLQNTDRFSVIRPFRIQPVAVIFRR